MIAHAQSWLNLPLGAAVLRVPLQIARCPGCQCDPSHPSARACDRIGCPIKHMGLACHETSIVAQGERDHG